MLVSNDVSLAADQPRTPSRRSGEVRHRHADEERLAAAYEAPDMPDDDILDVVELFDDTDEGW